MPQALRKDHWKPFFVVNFGLPHQGLNAFKKLREWRKLHEVSWDPKDVAKLELTDAQRRTRTKRREEREANGGARKGGARARLTEWKLRKKMTIMNQKANSVADLAAVLVEQEQKLAEWSPEREKILTDVMQWLPKLVTEGKHRKVRLEQINLEIAQLEHRIKDAKAATGKTWSLPLASKITNLNRDLKLKKTEYYQISHLPELFNLSRFAQTALWEKNTQFEALWEKEFLIRWQYAKMEDELSRCASPKTTRSEDPQVLEIRLDQVRAELSAQAATVRDLEESLPDQEGDAGALREHTIQMKAAISEIKQLKSKVVLLKSQLFRSGSPPNWLKTEVFEKRSHDAVERLLRRKPKLAANPSFHTEQIDEAIDDALNGLYSDSTSKTSSEAQRASAREIRELAKQVAIEQMKQIRKDEEAELTEPTGHDQILQLSLKLKDFGNYKMSTTWFTAFPDFVSRFFTRMTSFAPKLTREIRMGDVSVDWNNPLDAEYGREWPAEVQHKPMGYARNTAPSEKHEKLLEYNNEAFEYDASGNIMAGQRDTAPTLIPELQERADAARANVLIRTRQLAAQRSSNEYRLKLAEPKRRRLEKLAQRDFKGEVGKALKQNAIRELAALDAELPMRPTQSVSRAQLTDARATLEAARRSEAQSPPPKLDWSRRKGMGHYGLHNLNFVKVKDCLAAQQ